MRVFAGSRPAMTFSAPSTLQMNPALSMATRRFDHDPAPTRMKKHKGAAKERRRIVRARKAEADKAPHERGEEISPFFLPARYKLILKFMQEHKNSRRLQRKPMPQEKKDWFAEKSKARSMYVQAQVLQVAKEREAFMKAEFQAQIATIWLPEYLQDEIDQQGGEEASENLREFTPAMLYQEQILRLFPKEVAVRLKMLPAFEETFMRW